MNYNVVGYSLLIAAVFVVSSCSSASKEPVWKQAVAGDGPGNPALIQAEVVKVANLPKSRSGNRSEYEVFGVRYAVLDSARDFTERGVASWYGSKFHGRATASGEIYDMHQLTAAHKHLPLPTFVRVTRMDTGQSIVVKVNDRGPFVGDRIIDLSYAAAATLDMLDSGKAEVIIEALSDHDSGTQKQQSTSGNNDHALVRRIQVGAFSQVANAEALQQQVESVMQLPVYVEFEQAQQLYIVRTGPLQSESIVDNGLRQLESAGLHGFPVPGQQR